jgi:hypothetical protein
MESPYLHFPNVVVCANECLLQHATLVVSLIHLRSYVLGPHSLVTCLPVTLSSRTMLPFIPPQVTPSLHVSVTLQYIKHHMSTDITYPHHQPCRNVYIHHGSISHLRGLVQIRRKDNKGQKKNNLRFRLYFLLQIYFKLFSHIKLVMLN